MATSALPAPVTPALDGSGTNLGVCGPSGAAAGMTPAVAGAGNGKTFPNLGGQTRLLVANVHASASGTITPKRTQTSGGLLPTDDVKTLLAGEVRVLRFSSHYQDANGDVTVEASATTMVMLAIY